MRYRNHEGYADPTAGAALASITRDERRKQRPRLQTNKMLAPKDRPSLDDAKNTKAEVDR